MRAGWSAWLLLAGAWSAAWTQQSHVWHTNPEYNYGFVVPLLAAILFAEAWRDRPGPAAAIELRRGGRWFVVVAALFLIPARLLLEGFPGWPVPLWLHAAATIVLTLGCLHVSGGRNWVRHFAGATVFALTALPWPNLLHRWTVQTLAPTVAELAAFFVDLAGPAAVAHGAVIETAHGVVGVDEACSGIRSLQAAVMTGLFVGEYLRWSRMRRVGFLLLAVTLAFVANVVRTTFLTWRAAEVGVEASAQWHDAAGWAMLGLNLAILVFVATWWHRPTRAPRLIATQDSGPVARPPGTASIWAAIAFLIVAEVSSVVWFRLGPMEGPFRRLVIQWPESARNVAAMPVPPEAIKMLGCDSIARHAWRAPDGGPRQAVFIHWDSTSAGRGSTALHSPEICLPLAGSALIARPGPIIISAGGQSLRFEVLRFRHATGEFQVYHHVHDDAPLSVGASNGALGWWCDRLGEIWHARRGSGIDVLTVAMWGDISPEQAGTELRALLGANVAPALDTRP